MKHAIHSIGLIIYGVSCSLIGAGKITFLSYLLLNLIGAGMMIYANTTKDEE